MPEDGFSLTRLFPYQGRIYPANTPRVFHVETTWKRSFPRRFYVEYTWCVCRVQFCLCMGKDGSKNIRILEYFTLCFTLTHQHDPRITYYNDELQREHLFREHFFETLTTLALTLIFKCSFTN